MNDEVEEIVKESGAKSPKRKMGKKGKIAIIATVLVIAILIGAYVAMIFMAPSEKYWKPEKEFKMPAVDWNKVNSSYTIIRSHNGLIHHLRKSIGIKQINIFKIYFIINITKYAADIDGTGYLDLVIYTQAQKVKDCDYKIKSLEFKFDYGNDSNVSYLSLTGDKIAAKNLYFDVTPRKYNTKLYYEWMDNFRITGENKNGEDIKEAGFSFPMKILFFDTYPHWYNHTITFTTILEYGKYVHGWFGTHWEDVHKLSASVVIYVVPEGGE